MELPVYLLWAVLCANRVIALEISCSRYRTGSTRYHVYYRALMVFENLTRTNATLVMIVISNEYPLYRRSERAEPTPTQL